MHPIYLTPIGIPRTRVNIESIALVGFVPSREPVRNPNCSPRFMNLLNLTDVVDPSLKKFLGSEERKQYAQWKRQQICNIYHYIVSELHRYFKRGEGCWSSYYSQNIWYSSWVYLIWQFSVFITLHICRRERESERNNDANPPDDSDGKSSRAIVKYTTH